MGWNASLSASSALGSAITFTPDTTTEGAYTVAAFTAPKKAVYRFLIKGSGGTVTNNGGSSSAGGTGGTTTGYLLLEAGQKVYVGAGGPCSAAFVSKVTGSKLSSIAKENLYFVAGGGGGGGAMWGQQWNMKSGPGGNGGGSSGASGSASPDIGTGGSGGTQTSGFAYGGVGHAPKPTAGGKDLSVFKIGVKVSHPKFGAGIIVGARGAGSNMILDKERDRFTLQ